MKKRIVSMLLTAMIAFSTSAVAVSAESSQVQSEQTIENKTTVSWCETYDSLYQVISNSDICIVGTVISQEIEERDGIYFTHSFVENTDGKIYDILQTGAILAGNYVNVPSDAALMENGEDYFLCLNQAECDGYGDYYLITGGNQGYGKFDAQNSTVVAANYDERSLFNLFAIDLSESLSFDSISELSIPSFLDQTITRAITPAEGHSWNKSNLICYISPTISSLYGSGVYNAIKAGANGWSSTNAPSISITSNILSYDISIDMGDCGTTGWDGISNYYWIGNYYTLSDIQLNTTYLIDYLSNTGLWQAMTCHEMGHSLGLDHNTTTTSIMQPNTVDYYDYRDGDPNIKTPRVVDRAGMNAIYS